MELPKYLKLKYPSDAYKGTAFYYSRYRVPYPQILFDDLIKRTALPTKGVLLDLASGPGRIAIRIAHLFAKVYANDIEPEMIKEGNLEAEKFNVNNIEWLKGKAEKLKMKSNSIDFITIGEAFHRLDQDVITNLSMMWLKPGGHIAIIGCYGIVRGNELWQDSLRKIVNKWTSKNFSSQPNGSDKVPELYRLILQDKGFEEINSHSFNFPHYWTIESIIGNFYSTSFFSKKALGNNSLKFESEIKTALKNINKKGSFFENILCGYTLAEKPIP